MYSKVDLIENKKLEKVIRANKYKIRNQQIKRAKRNKLHKISEFIFLSIFWTFMFYFIYQLVSYIFIRL